MPPGSRTRHCALCDYHLPVDDLAARLRAGAPFAFVCTPHNPTGGVLDEAALATLHRAALAGGGVLIVDGAYGLAGLRVGYMVGDPAVIAKVDRLHSAVPYHVNRLAQRAAVAALANQRFMHESVARTVATREQPRDRLLALGLRCLPSQGNFVLVHLGPHHERLAVFLRDNGFAVRDTADMGLPHHIRVSIGTPDRARRRAAAGLHARLRTDARADGPARPDGGGMAGPVRGLGVGTAGPPPAGHRPQRHLPPRSPLTGRAGGGGRARPATTALPAGQSMTPARPR